MAGIIQDSHQFLVNTTLVAQWEDTLPYPTTRKIYRHESNEGSVIEFDMFGKKVKLFVADAKHRFEYFTEECFNSILNGNRIGYVNPQDMRDNETKALSYNLTDNEIQLRYSALSKCKTALENTSGMISMGDTGAPAKCREKSIRGLGSLDLPNAYELVVIYLESDNIDALDPTATSHPNLALGHRATNGRFHATYGSFWSSDSLRSYNVTITSSGDITGINPGNARGVCPVKELSIS